ncbi:MAG: DNA mismatch repair protein MutS [Alphaproteobacteria bacterium]|nr:DNA mismatch repair protein MutS [Alphaproteobacteria bacterium]
MTDLNEAVTPSMRQYLDIKKDYQDYLVFYRMGDFYELFYEDAVVASKALDLVLTSRSKDMNVPMCGVPFHAYESYLAKLIRQGYKVAIAEQTETPEEAKKRGRNALVNREIIRLVTPGTLTESNLLDDRKNNFLLCISKDMLTLGFAWLDMSTGDLFVKRIETDEASLSVDIYNMVSKIEPSEIIVSNVLYATKSLMNFFTRSSDKNTVLPIERFNVPNAINRIKKFYQINDISSFGALSNPEISAIGVILDYVETTQKEHLPHIKNPVGVNDVKYMEIDAATRRNLELLFGTDGARQSSFLNAIDKTITAAGARLFRQRLIYPSLNVFEINRRLDCETFFINAEPMCKDLRDIFKTMSDMERILTRVSNGTCRPKELVSLKQSLASLARIKTIVQNYGHYGDLIAKLEPAVVDILGRIGDFSELVDFLDQALKHDSDENAEKLPAYFRDGGFVRDGFDVRLDEYRNLSKNDSDYTQILAAKYNDELSISSVKVKYNTLIGYFIEIPKKDCDSAFNNLKFVHRQTVLNAVRFTTAELSDLEQKINSANSKALAIEMEIYDEIVTKVLAEAKTISSSCLALAELDIACASAELARARNYVRPVLDDSLCFDIKEGRHVVVEAALEKMHEGPFVTNTCRLDGQKDRLWLITGPNMAGKSTFLRQNALIAIMAQMGMYVPAKSAHIGLIDKVLSRVGASDDLSRGRSTFMVEMVETAMILNQSTSRSFVILDEIGRGTATYDGLSIAWAVVEHLVEVNQCRALFATHYHELTVLQKKLKAISLHAMKIKEYNGNVVFMHEVIDGVADRSYGVHVAKLAGVPKLVTKRAEQILKVLEENSGDKKITSIEDDLPLFAVFKKDEEGKKKISPLDEALEKLNPDNLTPREALDKLYELKVLYQTKEG